MSGERWPALMSQEQAAEYLGCSVSKLRMIRDEPEQPVQSVMLGGLVRFRRRELDEYIESLPYGRQSGRERRFSGVNEDVLLGDA